MEGTDQDVIVLFRRNDGENVLSFAQYSGRNGQDMDQRSFHKEELAQIGAVEADRPLLLYVGLFDDERLGGRIASCRETEFQFRSFRFLIFEFVPFRLRTGAQMMLPSCEHLSWGCCAKLARSSQNQDKDSTFAGVPQRSHGSLQKFGYRKSHTPCFLRSVGSQRSNRSRQFRT